jgi:hypothetical protein
MDWTGLLSFSGPATLTYSINGMMYERRKKSLKTTGDNQSE